MKNHFKIIEDQNTIPSHEERNGSMGTDGSIGLKHFTNIDHDEALSRPFFFSIGSLRTATQLIVDIKWQPDFHRAFSAATCY
jgi:hypothetical protein